MKFFNQILTWGISFTQAGSISLLISFMISHVTFAQGSVIGGSASSSPSAKTTPERGNVKTPATAVVPPAEDPAPATPSKPLSLYRSESGCRRSFTYQRQDYPLDSGRRQDGEGLKKILVSNPEAYRLLTQYQSGAATNPVPAYIGSLGILTLIAASFAPAQLSTDYHNQKLIRYGFAATGIITVGLAYFLHQWGLKKNELELVRAVETFNQGQLPVKQVHLNLNTN